MAIKLQNKSKYSDARQYRYIIAWSELDGAFIGRVTEFPSLAAHGSTQKKTLREIRTVVGYVLEDLAQDGAEIPVP